MIWQFFLLWAQSLAEDHPHTAKAVYDRFLVLKPEKSLEYLSFLLEHDMLEDALSLYYKLLTSTDAQLIDSLKKTRFELTMEMCEFISRHPKRSQHLKVNGELILRHALAQYSDEGGRLWIFLADYHTRMGLFGKARDAFEEALAQLNRARDFGIIFNAYMKFEEAMLDLDIEDSSSDESEGDKNSSDSEEESLSSQIDMLLDFTYKDIPGRNQESEDDGEGKLTKEDKENMKFFRLENLIERRPFLLSNVVLRQNPNNVNEWISRLKLCKEDVYLAIKTFTEAIQAIDPMQAVGKASKIWIEFAGFYEQY